jgi:hypothetical protein
MTDCIFRDAAIEAAWVWNGDESTEAWIQSNLKNLPAADVRPVVLCRDCRNWDTDWTPTHARANEHFCPIIGLTTREDWFCADGEKMEKS